MQRPHWLTLSLGLGCVIALGAGCAETPPPASSSTPAAAPAASASASAATTPAPAAPSAADYKAIVDAPDRSEADRALDAGRKPAELLAFIGVRPGMKVAEIGAGGGYTSELLARAVGPSGVVYGQNSKFLLERFAEKPWSERLAKPEMKNVVRVDRDFDDPLPPEARNLDAVVNVLFYHDTVWQKANRDRMNQAIYQALKPGGVYVILDHSGRPGTGNTETESLHRIEESALREEVLRAGFKVLRESSAWRNAGDTRDWSASPRVAGEKRGTSDRFAIAFVK